METSKHSEEAIINLGKKLIEELELPYTTDTLTRWMVHYLAELIQTAEQASSIQEKRKLQKECCDIILKLWSNKETLPIARPLENLDGLVKILEALQEKPNHEFPLWYRQTNFSNDSFWSDFIKTVKINSERIFQQVLDLYLHGDLLEKEKEWLQEHEEFLTESEISFIRNIDFIIQIKNGEQPDTKNLIKASGKERMTHVFDELEVLIEEQQRKLDEVKKRLLQK